MLHRVITANIGPLLAKVSSAIQYPEEGGTEQHYLLYVLPNTPHASDSLIHFTGICERDSDQHYLSS